MTTLKDARRGALLTDDQRRSLTAELKREYWQNVRGQCQGRQWPGKLQAWDVSPDGRVLAGIQTRQALIWMDAGPQPAVSQQDPRMQALLADREARNQAWRATGITERSARNDRQR
jgi:hypothetical protein